MLDIATPANYMLPVFAVADVTNHVVDFELTVRFVFLRHISRFGLSCPV